MILNDECKPTMILIIHKVGLILQIINGLGEYREALLQEDYLLEFNHFLILISMDSKLFIPNIYIQKTLNK